MATEELAVAIEMRMLAGLIGSEDQQHRCIEKLAVWSIGTA